jgi:prepilin-type N-terminal cleavage/methylation domain-containing protein
MPTRLSRRVTDRLHAVRAERDAGVTLMEVMVAMTLSTVLGAMTLALFVNINTASSDTTDRTISTSSVRNALQSWTAYLRVADGTTPGSRLNRIEWLTAKDMLFYADVNNRSMSSVGTTAAPTMIWIRLDPAGQLVEEQFVSTAAVNAAPKVCRILAMKASVAGSLFRGFDANGADMTGQGLGTAPAPVTGCRPLPVTVPSRLSRPDPIAQANLQNVRSVSLDVIVRDTRNGHPLEFTSQAVLPNLGGSL